jgi:hypothetical protein
VQPDRPKASNRVRERTGFIGDTLTKGSQREAGKSALAMIFRF